MIDLMVNIIKFCSNLMELDFKNETKSNYSSLSFIDKPKFFGGPEHFKKFN